MALDLVVVGVGSVGLPPACEATRAGLWVAGLDTDESVRRAPEHLRDVLVSQIVDLAAPPRPGPDLRAVTAAMQTIGARLQPGSLVVLESTTFPGTTEDIVRPIPEAGSGLQAGTDFALAFSPERIDPGNATFGLRHTPKVVGGLTPECARRAEESR